MKTVNAMLLSSVVFALISAAGMTAHAAGTGAPANSPQATAGAAPPSAPNLAVPTGLGQGQLAAGSAVTAPGFYWDRCQQAYRALGATTTWCYLESNAAWISVNDNEGEALLIACAESYHYCGINVTSVSGGSFSFNQLRLYKY